MIRKPVLGLLGTRSKATYLEKDTSAGLPQEWSLRVSQLLTFSSMSEK